MSENIYDILAKFPKDLPTSPMESEPIYETVDHKADTLTEAQKLQEKFEKYKATPNVSTNKTDDSSDFKIAKANRELQLAMAEYPEAGSPTEALVARMGDQAEETKKVIDNAKATITKQQREIDQTAQAVNDANARYDAQEKRFQEFNQQVAASELNVKQQAQAALAFAKQPQDRPADIISKVQAQAPQTPTTEPKVDKEEPTATPTPTNVVAMPTAAKPAPAKKTSQAQNNISQFPYVPAPTGDEEDSEEAKNDGTYGDEEEEKNDGTNGESMKQNKKIIKEDRQEGDPLLGMENWGLISQGYQKAADQVVLSFAGNKVPVTASQMFGLVQVFNSMQSESKDMFVKKNLAFYNSTMQLLNSPQVIKAQEDFPEYQASNPVWRKKMAVTAKKYNPKQLDFFGNPNMSENINKLATSLMERFAKFSEDAKPDFLDLDKDGDTDEPMKSAAKSAKDDEPAKPDSDAVAKRKRLQALKDKQEDERAEKDDDYKSASRVVKGRAYGGAAQKDDEDKDELEEDLNKYSTAKLKSAVGKDKDADAKSGVPANYTTAQVKAELKKRENLEEGKFKEIYTDMMDYATKKGYSSHKQFTPADYDALAKPHGISGKELAVALGHKKVSQVAEVAPPGAKAERMVKHVKKGYSKDGNLSKREKGIAYATAWKAHNKGQVEEATEFSDKIKNSKAELKKHKMVKEGRNAESSEYTYETVGRILSDEQSGLDCNSEAFVKAVYDELIELKMTPKAARWLVHYDEDFISDTASAYSHFCDSKAKEAMECGAPMNSFVSEEPLLDAEHELAEIAKLAGLAREDFNPMVPGDSASPLTHTEEGMGCSEDELNEAATRKDFRMVADLLKSIPDIAKRTELALYHADIFKEQNPRFKRDMFLAAAGVDTTPIKDAEDEVLVSEEEVGEGNEFSGALAKAKAAGAKEFEVDGKKYTVKEDININVTANGEEDVVNLIRKLSGMPVVAIQAQPAMAEEVVAEEGPKERDVEYTNTPREEVAGTDAAIPSGGDLNRAKKQYRKEYPGDNPMAVKEAIQNMLWNDYQSMINDVKA